VWSAGSELCVESTLQGLKTVNRERCQVGEPTKCCHLKWDGKM